MHLKEVYAFGEFGLQATNSLLSGGRVLLHGYSKDRFKYALHQMGGNDMDKRQVLQSITFGERIAEDEVDELSCSN